VAFAVVRCSLRMTFRHNGTVVWTKAATSDVQHSLAAVVGSKAVAAMKYVQRSSLQPPVHSTHLCAPLLYLNYSEVMIVVVVYRFRQKVRNYLSIYCYSRLVDSPYYIM